MLKALGKNLIVTPIEEEKKDKLVLTLRENKPLFWKVLSIGEDVREISVGDIVCIHHYGMEEYDHNDEKIFVVEMCKIYAKK
jgi:co-chaperonin GroES (HSP10)